MCIMQLQAGLHAVSGRHTADIRGLSTLLGGFTDNWLSMGTLPAQT